MSFEEGETPRNNQEAEDFSGGNMEVSNGSLLVDTKVLATDKWREMTDLTQSDLRERGLL